MARAQSMTEQQTPPWRALMPWKVARTGLLIWYHQTQWL